MRKSPLTPPDREARSAAHLLSRRPPRGACLTTTACAWSLSLTNVTASFEAANAAGGGL
jgi:hypothetical protein